jgi:copper chaperone CopZ
MRDKVTLAIEGMHCEGCVRRVTAALQGIRGADVVSVEVGSAQIRFDPELVSREEIAEAVNRIGFSARLEKS